MRVAPSMLLLAAGALFGCAVPPPPEPVEFRSAPVPTDVRTDVNWPHPPIATLEEMEAFDRDEITGMSVAGTGGGETGTRKVAFGLEDQRKLFVFKGRTAPHGTLDGFNDSPRKQMAAYWIQFLFLEPVDFVVPFSIMRCIPHELWNRHALPRPSTVAGTECVLANVSLFLRDVVLPDELWEPDRFLREANYAYHLAHFNLHAYLIQNRDAGKGNVVVSIYEQDRRVFAVDNGIAFGDRIYNWFLPETYAWQHIRVPGLPARTVQRLRDLRRDDLDFLGTVQQLRTDAEGILRITDPKPPFDPDLGVRIRGGQVQFGLTRTELEALWQRIGRLLRRIDRGEIRTF